MRKYFVFWGIVTSLLIILLAGCSTTVAFDVLRPAEVNMADYRKLAVFDYEPYKLSDENFAGKLIFNYVFGSHKIATSGYRIFLDDEIADYLTKCTIRALNDTDYFTIIPQEQIRPSRAASTSSSATDRMLYENFGIDAAIVGSVEDMDYFEQIEEREITVPDGSTQTETFFVQGVELGISYTVIDLKRGTIITTDYLSGRDSQSTLIKDPDSFSAPLLGPLYRGIARGFESKISKRLAPYHVREYRTIKKDKTKDPRSDSAKKFIKDNLYKKALNLYLEMWCDSENFSAGFNAAIVYEVLGQFDSAISMMKDVYDSTGSPDAYKEYQRLIDVKKEYQRAAAQY